MDQDRHLAMHCRDAGSDDAPESSCMVHAGQSLILTIMPRQKRDPPTAFPLSALAHDPQILPESILQVSL